MNGRAPNDGEASTASPFNEPVATPVDPPALVTALLCCFVLGSI